MIIGTPFFYVCSACALSNGSKFRLSPYSWIGAEMVYGMKKGCLLGL